MNKFDLQFSKHAFFLPGYVYKKIFFWLGRKKGLENKSPTKCDTLSFTGRQQEKLYPDAYCYKMRQTAYRRWKIWSSCAEP